MTGANLEKLVKKTKAKIGKIRFDAFREHLLKVTDNTNGMYGTDDDRFSRGRVINYIQKIGQIADSYCSLMNK